MIYENKKTKIILCSFWEKGICKYMAENDKCRYAHGIEDLKIVVDCKYGSRCNRVDCKYNHGYFLPQDINKIYEFPITIKKKSKKNSKNDDAEIYNIENNISKDYKQIIINNKNNGVSIGIQTDNIDSIMDINLNQKVFSRSKNKLEKIYQKWVNVHNIFEKYNYNYKLIKENLNEIHVYIKDKNIYKVKERAIKIYKYYNKLKINKNIEFLTISNILKIKI